MSPALRAGLAAAGMKYVLDARPDKMVWPLEPTWTKPPYQGRGQPRQPKALREERQTVARRSQALGAEAWREITVAEGSQGPRNYRYSAPTGADNVQTKTRRNPLGNLSPGSGRQRAPLLPVQRP